MMVYKALCALYNKGEEIPHNDKRNGGDSR